MAVRLFSAVLLSALYPRLCLDIQLGSPFPLLATGLSSTLPQPCSLPFQHVLPPPPPRPTTTSSAPPFLWAHICCPAHASGIAGAPLPAPPLQISPQLPCHSRDFQLAILGPLPAHLPSSASQRRGAPRPLVAAISPASPLAASPPTPGPPPPQGQSGSSCSVCAQALSQALLGPTPPPTPHNSVFKFPSLQKQKQNKQEYESRQCRQPPFHLNTGENYRFLGPQPRLQGQAAGDQPRKLGGGGNLLSSMILLREVGKIQPHGCGCVSEPPGALTPSRCCPSFPGAVGGQERAASLASVPALQQASSGRG